MGSVQINPEFAEHLRGHGLREFGDFFDYAEGEMIGSHAARNVVRVNIGGLHAYLKREKWIPLKSYWTNWWSGFGAVSKSRREWCVVQRLRALGIPAPEPIAVGDRQGQAFLLLREIPDMMDLHSYLRQNADLSGSARRQLAQALGETLARFHAAGCVHSDLYSKHVLMRAGDQMVQFIDYQRTRIEAWPSWRQRWRDLAALDASFHPALVSRVERLTCLTAYLRATGNGLSLELLRQSLRAIDKRSKQLQRRRKVQRLRQAFAPCHYRSESLHTAKISPLPLYSGGEGQGEGEGVAHPASFPPSP